MLLELGCVGCMCDCVDGWADDGVDCKVRCSTEGMNAGGSSVLKGRMSCLCVAFRVTEALDEVVES